MVEVTIDSVRVSLVSQYRLVVLKESGAERYLPIWIGPFEAEAITLQMQGVEVPRPLTHDLLKKMITTLGGHVSHIVVTDLRQETFYANIVLDVDGRRVEIDSRPSDAIALAVRTSVKIFVNDTVMENAGIMPEDDISGGQRAGDELVAAYDQLGGAAGGAPGTHRGQAVEVADPGDVEAVGGGAAGHNVHLGLKAAARHAHGIPYSILSVEGVAAGECVDDLPIVCYRLHPCRLAGTFHVVGGNLADIGRYGNNASAVHASDMRASDPDVRRVDWISREALALENRFLNRLSGLIDVDYHALLHTARGRRADTDDAHLAPGVKLGDECADFSRADIKRGENVVSGHAGVRSGA